MKAVLIGLGVLIVLALGALFVLPGLVPSDTYRTRIQEQLSSELGRDVEITGDVRLSTFPVIRARAGGVRIANPEGFSRADLATLDGLDARIRLLPLLSRRVEIKSFTLRKPDIQLERRADGQVNWTFQSAEIKQQSQPENDVGPFKRDGRYTDMAPSIRAFNIENGTLRYRDDRDGTDATLESIDAFLSLPGLDQSLVIDGSLVAQGRPLDVELTLDSPAAFLNGLAAELDAELKSGDARMRLDGVIPAGEDFAFRGAVDGSVPDIAAFRDLLPENDYLTVLRSAEVSGALDIAGERYSLTDGKLSATGPAGSARFAGNARYDGQPVLDGRIEADITDAQTLAPLLPEPVTGFELLRTAKLSADLAADGDTAFSIRKAKGTVAGDGFTASYDGSGRYAEALSLDGAFTAQADDPARLARTLAPDVKGAGLLGRTTASGRLALQGDSLRVSDLVARTEGDTLSGQFDGALTAQGDSVTANGSFNVDIADLSAALARAGLDLDAAVINDAKAAGAVTAKGQLAYDGTVAQVTDIDATTRSEVATSRYTGALRYAEAASLDGRFEADVPALARLDQALTAELPYSDAVGRIALRGAVSGTPDDLTLSDLTARMSDGQLNGEFAGLAKRTSDAVTLDGTISASGDSLRALAARAGTELPVSTDSGPVFEAFALNGRVGGSTERLRLGAATLTLDQFKGAGDFALDMSGAKPRLSGTLDMGALDLRPYMNAYSAQNPTGEIQPWSTQPLPVDALRAINADLDLKASAVKLTRLSLGPTTMKVTLDQGRLSADVPALSLYGGKGRASFALDGSGSVPRIDMTASLDQLNSEGFLGAVAGFAQASGTAGTSVSLSGTGRSQAEIMRSLGGQGDFKVLDGAIRGIDAGAFLTGLDDALRSRALPGGIGADKATQFRDLLGAFRIENGVASIDRFALDAVGVRAEGEGRIDLGAQTIDFRFRPKATGETARGLAAFGIPLQFSGPFGGAKAGLDTDFLGKIAAERARAEAAKAVTDRVSGPVGNILGSVIGGTSPSGDPAAPGQPTPAQPQLDQVLGSLLGGSRSQPAAEPSPTAPSPQAPAANEPEAVEDTVLGLFGLKRPKKETKPAPEPQDR